MYQLKQNDSALLASEDVKIRAKVRGSHVLCKVMERSKEHGGWLVTSRYEYDLNDEESRTNLCQELEPLGIDCTDLVERYRKADARAAAPEVAAIPATTGGVADVTDRVEDGTDG